MNYFLYLFSASLLKSVPNKQLVRKQEESKQQRRFKTNVTKLESHVSCIAK